MPTFDYESHDATSLAELVRTKEVSPEELLDAAVDRVEQQNPQINAVVYPFYEGARQAIADGLPDGPFRGVPFLLKDFGTPYAGLQMSSGSGLFAEYIPDHNSALVDRYRAAGLVIFGRSTSPEFGLTTTTESRVHGQTHNPWNLAHTAGGSSGGAGAAVAAGILPMANASDGGGSIRVPASCCGLFGLKPTRARTPAGPDAGEGWGGMSTVHAITRSVRDSAALLDATAGPDIGAPYWAERPPRPFASEVGTPPGQLRIAFQTQTFNGAETDPACIAAVEAVAHLCADLGHEVEEANLQVDREELGRATPVIVAANTRALVEDRAAQLGRAFTEADLETATYVMVTREDAGAAAYARATRAVHAAGRRVATFLEDYDCLLTPTMAVPPLELGRLSLDNPDQEAYTTDLLRTIGYTSLFNASGNPAVSVPLIWNDAGLPIGTQFVGRYGDEATLLRLAGQLEEAQPWAGRRPPC